jgi:protease I
VAKKEAAAKQELDEHGLVVQKHERRVLVVVPRTGFAETALRYARSSLMSEHVGTGAVSADDSGLLRGELQDEFQPDGHIADARMADFGGVIFCGGPGAASLDDDPDALRLAREAVGEKKLVAAWGRSIGVLARAQILRGKRVTGDPKLADVIRGAGGRYTGAQVERDGWLVTALDDAAGLRFGKALVEAVKL